MKKSMKNLWKIYEKIYEKFMKKSGQKYYVLCTVLIEYKILYFTIKRQSTNK